MSQPQNRAIIPREMAIFFASSSQHKSGRAINVPRDYLLMAKHGACLREKEMNVPITRNLR